MGSRSTGWFCISHFAPFWLTRLTDRIRFSRIIGFEELGNNDNFATAQLEKRLAAKSGTFLGPRELWPLVTRGNLAPNLATSVLLVLQRLLSFQRITEHNNDGRLWASLNPIPRMTTTEQGKKGKLVIIWLHVNSLIPRFYSFDRSKGSVGRTRGGGFWLPFNRCSIGSWLRIQNVETK